MREEFRTIKVDHGRCGGHMACMRICPAQAIRVRDGKAWILKDRCIDCGECVRVCPTNAIVPQTSTIGDFSRFRYTIAIPSPALYSQFGGDVPTAAILAALRKIGFDDSYDAACASESVSIAIQEHLDSASGPRPFIAPFCPAIVRLIQLRYPNLLEHLIPIESPMEIAAREAKRLRMKELGLKETEIGAIYLTPCPAKMRAIKHPPRKKHSFVDGTIAISALYPAILQALGENGGNGVQEVRGLGLGWPFLGGQVASLKAEDCLAIGGLTDAMRIFEDIENGRLKNIQYIEVHSCPTACVGGSLNVENPYIARGRVLRMVRKAGGQPCQDREKIRELYQKHFFSLPGKIDPVPQPPLDDDVQKALEKLRQRQVIYDRLPHINCGACGSPTCLTFAEDVVKGEMQEQSCVFTAIRRLESQTTNLIETLRSHGIMIPDTMEGREYDTQRCH